MTMHRTTFATRTSPTIARAARALSVGALWLTLGLVPMVGCDRQPGQAAAPATGGAQADGHDHGEHADEVTLTGEAIERYGVKVADAQLWILKPTFMAAARVGFNTEAMAHVGSPLRGRVVEIKVRLGDSVRKDDPLMVVESPELGEAQADFLLKSSAAQAAAPHVDLAKAAWDRGRALQEQSQGISLTEVQKREAEYKTAVATLKAAEAAAMSSKNSLQLLGMDQGAVERLASTGEIAPRHTVRAAMGGHVVQRDVTLGELVSAERDSLMVLADTSTLWVLADVPEASLHAIAPGAKAWVMVSTHKHEGQVAFVSPLVDPTTRTAQVRIEVPSAALGNGAVKPGMFARVEIVAAGADPAPQIAVPQEAVQTVEGGPAVFVPVAGEPNTFQKRALKVGPAVGGLVPVFSGLVEGERFVEAGSFILKADLGKGSAAHQH